MYFVYVEHLLLFLRCARHPQVFRVIEDVLSDVLLHFQSTLSAIRSSNDVFEIFTTWGVRLTFAHLAVDRLCA